MEQLGCIYYIFCKETGKGYVGQTKYPSPENRYKEHWNAVGRKCNLFLHKAMRKYGREAFTIERLCVVPHEALGRMEEYWAEQLQTYMWDIPGGYNMVWCGATGSLGVKLSDEAKENMRIAQTGRKHSEETKEKMRQSQIGKKRSSETKEKMKQIALNRSDETKKKIGQSSKNRFPSDEAKEKMRQSHLAYWAKVRAAKAALLPSNTMANVEGQFQSSDALDSTCC